MNVVGKCERVCEAFSRGISWGDALLKCKQTPYDKERVKKAAVHRREVEKAANTHNGGSNLDDVVGPSIQKSLELIDVVI